MTTKRIEMFRPPIFRTICRGMRELCGITIPAPSPPPPQTIVKEQRRIRITAPREIPLFLMEGESVRRALWGEPQTAPEHERAGHG